MFLLTEVSLYNVPNLCLSLLLSIAWILKLQVKNAKFLFYKMQKVKSSPVI